MDPFATIQQVIATTLKVPPDKITRETSEKDLAAWDSIAHINLLMGLEEAFDLFIEVEDFAKLTSVAAIVEYLKEQNRA